MGEQTDIKDFFFFARVKENRTLLILEVIFGWHLWFLPHLASTLALKASMIQTTANRNSAQRHDRQLSKYSECWKNCLNS